MCSNLEVVIGAIFKNLSPDPSPKERGDVSGGKMSNNLQFYTHTSVAVQLELIRVHPRHP